MASGGVGPHIRELAVSAYVIPTDAPESDGTLEWDKTTVVLVQTRAGDQAGLGYTYADASVAALIRNVLHGCVVGEDAMDVGRVWGRMVGAIRNLGRAGLASMAIAAVDVALWDLKARLLDVPLAVLLGRSRNGVEVYGSGGFTSYSNQRLVDQLAGWAASGIRQVKMKIGREPAHDLERVRLARQAIGDGVGLYVDANGAYSRKQALESAERFADLQVTWFEEPVSSDDLAGLRLIRDRAPAGMSIAAGEYGYDLPYFRRMLEAGAVDVLQADATRCAGITGFLKAAATCEAFGLPLSAHTAPALHLPLCCAITAAGPLEYFHDHVRIERLLFDGAPEPINGCLAPDLTRPGLGLELKTKDADAYAC